MRLKAACIPFEVFLFVRGRPNLAGSKAMPGRKSVSEPVFSDNFWSTDFQDSEAFEGIWHINKSFISSFPPPGE